MSNLQEKSKSPMTLLFLIFLLVISTLVMISHYFLRPGLELDLKKRVISTLYSHNVTNAVIDVKGRDVVLKGITTNYSEAEKIEFEVQNIAGINHVKNKLLIKSDKSSR